MNQSDKRSTAPLALGVAGLPEGAIYNQSTTCSRVFCLVAEERKISGKFVVLPRHRQRKTELNLIVVSSLESIKV